MTTTLATLPFELIDAIAQHIPPADLLRLCSAGLNRDLQHTFSSHFYRAVRIETTEMLVGFCETVERNATLRGFVKSLHISAWCHMVSLSDDHLTSCALSIGKLGSLQKLELPSDTGTSLLAHLRGQAFPFLRLLCCVHTPNRTQIAPFLRSHPHIQNLCIHSPPGGPRWSEVPRITLPELHWFYGPEVLASAFIPNSNCANAAIVWSPLGPERQRGGMITPEQRLRDLKKSGREIEAMFHSFHEWETIPLDLLVRYFGSSLTELRFEGRSTFNVFAEEESLFIFLESMKHVLPHLPHLTSLQFGTAGRWPRDRVRTYAAHWSWIQALAALCPTLSTLVFFHAAQWQPIGDELRWLPVAGSTLHDSSRFATWFNREFPDVLLDDLREENSLDTSCLWNT